MTARGRLKAFGWLLAIVLAFAGLMRLPFAAWLHWPIPALLLLQEGIILGLPLGFAFLDGGGAGSLGLRGGWSSRDVLAIPALVGIQYLGSGLTVLVLMALHMMPVQQPAERVLGSFNAYPPLTFVLSALGLTLLVGLAEETLFRGYLMSRLERIGAGKWPAILVSAAVFGLAHWSGYGLLASISKGIWFGVPTAWYFWERRRLGPLVVAHALLDFSGLVLIYLVGRLGPQLPPL